jgi:hypothetical protein
MEKRAVILMGPFTKDDMDSIATTLRTIERKNQDALYGMLIVDDSNKVVEDMIEEVTRLLTVGKETAH